MTDKYDDEVDVLAEAAALVETEPKSKKKAAGPTVMQVVLEILESEGEGKLAQIGPFVHKDTQSEQGFVDYTSDIQRKACLRIGRCARKSGVMSALEPFIAVPQATAYRATPYFFWRSLDPSEHTEAERLHTNHWEPMVLAPSCVVFSDGILDLDGNTFKPWTEIGHQLYGPKVMLKYEEVLRAQPTAKFNEFLTTLETVLPNQEARTYFQKMMGSILRPHVNLKKAIFIQGPSGARKSTIATAILCAPAGVGGYSIEEIDHLAEKTHRQANLIGKWANLSDDPDGKAEKWVGWFKRYTGSSIMTGEFKYVQSRNYPISAKLVVCCNAIPKMGDSSDAVWSRLCVFKFQRVGELEEQFAGDSADNNKLQAEYWCDKDTRAAMVKWMLDGTQLAVNEGLRAPDAVKRWNDEACGEADPVRALLQEQYTKGEGFIPSAEVRAVLEQGGHYLHPASVASYLRTLFGVHLDRASVRGPDGMAVMTRGYKGMKRNES